MATRRRVKPGLWTPANIVTVARIFLVPLWLFVAETSRVADGIQSGSLLAWLSFALYLLISLTDKLDGYLARSRGEVSDFGKFLDPIADKLVVVMCMVFLMECGLVPSWMVLVVVAREFVVSGMRMVVAAKGTVVAASDLGKAKTATTMVGLCVLLFCVALPDCFAWGPLRFIGDASMWAAMALTAWSGIDYLVKSWPALSEG